MTNDDVYFVLSSSCKLVKGIKRSIIIDYQRGDLYFLSDTYFSLLSTMNRQSISDVEINLDDSESKKNFEEFLNIILLYQIGFLTKTIDMFPQRSDEINDTDLISLFDVIISIDPEKFNNSSFNILCHDLKILNCKDFQIRLLSSFDFVFLTNIIKTINTTEANYVEIHCDYLEGITAEKEIRLFIENNPLVSNVYLYDSPIAKVVDVVNYIPDRYPINLGHIFYVNYSFDGGSCCGIITQETLVYSSIDTHNRLKKRNGCLDRKLSIDKDGNIMNCPSMKNQYGNINEVSIKEVIKKEEFQKYWFINKDQISICKICEFRYNCTDCRAFLQDPDDLYSKPLKCGYNPYIGKWEDWSSNPLKEKGILIR